MKKTGVVLVRHAHADWPLYSGRDFDRPLTPRGEEEAREAARALRRAGVTPALLLASPAKRTRQTADAIAREFVLADTQIRFIDILYNAGAAELEAEVRAAAQEGQPVVLVAHNPGISQLARRLSGKPKRPPFAPAGWDHFELEKPSRRR